MKNISILMCPSVFKSLKVLAVQHGLRLGDTVGGLLRLAEASPAALVARCMAVSDGEAGQLVEPGDEARHIAQERARGALPVRADEF